VIPTLAKAFPFLKLLSAAFAVVITINCVVEGHCSTFAARDTSFRSSPMTNDLAGMIRGDVAVAALVLADLKKSGITESDEIKKLGLEALTAERTAALTGSNFFRVPSYAIPYFGIDRKPMTYQAPSGKLLPYVRFKLLGGIKSKDAKVIKYTQPSGSGIHLYLPPLVDWAAVAKDPKRKILITEGEKKSIAAILHLGIPTIGTGGVWSFKTPDLNGFVWKDRDVEIAYDGDPAAEDCL